MTTNSNRQFKIFGETWKVKYKKDLKSPEREDDGYVFGYTDASSHEIYINLTDRNGKDLIKDVLRATLLHELMHVVFISGQYLTSNNDEPLVEWTARCVDSLIKQKVI